MTDDAGTARAYHQRSKHSLSGFAAGPDTLDWDAQPDPFRRFAGAPLARLPLAADDLATTWSALATPGKVTPQPIALAGVAVLLELSLALTAWKQSGPDRWALRANPSSGNLHPTEAYVLATGVPGLADGLHHYQPREHALALRRPGRLTGRGQALWIGLSSIHWREAWKYGERAFRYCQLDVGHALGGSRMTRHEVRRQLLSIANALGVLDRDAQSRMPEIDWAAWATIAAALRLQAADIDATAWFSASALLPATLMWLQVYRRAEPSLFEYTA